MIPWIRMIQWFEMIRDHSGIQNESVTENDERFRRIQWFQNDSGLFIDPVRFSEGKRFSDLKMIQWFKTIQDSKCIKWIDAAPLNNTRRESSSSKIFPWTAIMANIFLPFTTVPLELYTRRPLKTPQACGLSSAGLQRAPICTTGE